MRKPAKVTDFLRCSTKRRPFSYLHRDVFVAFMGDKVERRSPICLRHINLESLRSQAFGNLLNLRGL